MTTWRILITELLLDLEESLIFCTLSEEELDKEFDDGYGCEEGKPFQAWTQSYVLFPVCYDGSEHVGYAHRDPCGIALNHWGG